MFKTEFHIFKNVSFKPNSVAAEIQENTLKFIYNWDIEYLVRCPFFMLRG